MLGETGNKCAKAYPNYDKSKDAECAAAYYSYGKTLLRMSRIESIVLDNAFEEVDMVDDPTEGNQVEDTDTLTKAEKLEAENSVADALEDNYEEIPADAENTEELEEAGHLEMAWEVLELAKLGWSKMSKSSTDNMKKEVDTNLAEAYLTLGEVAMDPSNYAQAQEDFQACIHPQEDP